MKPVQIVSLSAPRPRSGKDTLANQLIAHFGADKVATIAFGDYLRECVSHLFGHGYAIQMMECLHDNRKDIPTPMCTGTSLVHTDYREWMVQNGHNLLLNRSPRWHMQHFGNNYVKDHMGLHHFWIDVVDRRIEQLKRTNPNLELIIVTDTRSPNEFDWLGEVMEAKFIMVKRTGFPKDSHDDVTERHAVETFADNWKYDMTVWNHYGFAETMKTQALNVIPI